MFKISREFHFEMAHLLDGHDGKCQNLHGHSYKLQIEVSAPLQTQGAKKSMVIDFSELKAIVKKYILIPMDHAFIYDTNSQRERKIAQTLDEIQSKTYPLNTRSTVEEIARHIYNTLKPHLPIHKVRLWETAHAYCEYSAP